MAMPKQISEMHKKRRGHNIALAAVVIFCAGGPHYVMSIVRMSGGESG